MTSRMGSDNAFNNAGVDSIRAKTETASWVSGKAKSRGRVKSSQQVGFELELMSGCGILMTRQLEKSV